MLTTRPLGAAAAVGRRLQLLVRRRPEARDAWLKLSPRRGVSHCSHAGGVHGLRTCSWPFSARSFNEVLVPFASSTTYVSFVSVGPAKLKPDWGSDEPILTVGRPRSVIRRSRTVSAA